MVVVAAIVLPVSVRAIAPPENTISVDPAQLNLGLPDKDSSATATVTVSNNYAVPITLNAELKGIDTSAGKIVPTGDLDPQLAQTLRLSETSLTIPPQSKRLLRVQATNNPALQPGGHYATLVLSQASSAPKLGIKPQLSVGIFVVKEQGKTLLMRLVKQQLGRPFLGWPQTLQLDFLNDGNTHVVPRGYVRLSDAHRVYAESVLNSESTVILPAKHYTTKVSNLGTGTAWLPKKITLEVGYRTDGNNDMAVTKRTFWYVPPLLLMACSLIAGSIIAGFFILYVSGRKLVFGKPRPWIRVKKRLNSRPVSS